MLVVALHGVPILTLRAHTRVCHSPMLPRWQHQQPFTVVADGRDGDPARRRYANSRKGKSFSNKNRRRGRPAWTRSPDDSPLRDGNRDRLMGMLTDRAARTLLYYLMETNLNVHHWLLAFMRAYPIPRDGAWDDVSGETFLRKLLTMPVQEAKWNVGRADMYDTVVGIGVDPRNIAQRIMDIRTQLAKEWTSDLSDIAEENSLLLRESLASSLEKMFMPDLDMPVAPAADSPAEEPAP